MVVDLPLLPVTAIVRAGHRSQNRPISVVSFAPAASARRVSHRSWAQVQGRQPGRHQPLDVLEPGTHRDHDVGAFAVEPPRDRLA